MDDTVKVAGATGLAGSGLVVAILAAIGEGETVTFTKAGIAIIAALLVCLGGAIVALFRLYAATTLARVARAEQQVDTLLPALDNLTKAVEALTAKATQLLQAKSAGRS